MIVNIVSITSGSQDPDWVRLCISNYEKRFPRYCQLSYHLIKVSQANTASQRKKDEFLKIQLLHKKNKEDFFVFLDLTGHDLDTFEFKSVFSQWLLQHRRIWIIIGGPDGFHPQALQSANFILRLSHMTLPHLFAKVFIVEQLYRVTSLIEQTSYHR